ncbi:MAG: rRNA pseudouridine synthase [Clostridiales bacterium]|jgi:23S rRNA pseudouridine2605 synthase|nr:rRNA pseudouridine synthase [Clostridiales bacterium]
MRLQKYIALCGVASRRKAEQLILEGHVTVDGKIVQQLGTSIDETVQKVSVDGNLIKQEKFIYIMLNKPAGYICTAHDQFERKTVLDCLKNVNERVFPVGRLDYDTSGLLLLTNDGELTNKLTHPKHKIFKVYYVKTKGFISDKQIASLKNGVVITESDGNKIKTLPAQVEIIERNEKFSEIEIYIREGKNRQIRKMLESVGHSVTALKRIKIGNINIGELAVGEYRFLTKEEILYLKNL